MKDMYCTEHSYVLSAYWLRPPQIVGLPLRLKPTASSTGYGYLSGCMQINWDPDTSMS